MTGTLTVLSPLKVGGKLRPVGSPVDADLFSDEERARLIKHGILAEPPADDVSAPADDGEDNPAGQNTGLTSGADTDQADREAAITAAIRTLDPDTGFTKAGRPRVDALEKAVGFEVSADEVEAIAGTAEKLAAILGSAKGDQS